MQPGQPVSEVVRCAIAGVDGANPGRAIHSLKTPVPSNDALHACSVQMITGIARPAEIENRCKHK